MEAAYGLAVLADGMGGYNAGEVASGMATAMIRSDMVEWLDRHGKHADTGKLRQALALCANKANMAIYAASCSEAQYAGMGTTLVLAVLHRGMMVIGHLGDSRAYRLRGEELQQLTRDHSMLQEQLDAGLISSEEAQYSLHKNLVTRAIGIETDVFLETNVFQAEPGDLYLLCSDGLSDMIGDSKIRELLKNSDNLLDKQVQLLVDSANEAGGRDNISVILVRLEKDPEKGLWGRFKQVLASPQKR